MQFDLKTSVSALALSALLEVLEYVKRTPGAVGYVTTVPRGVTVVQKY